jgi:hypothetical protein
VKVIFDPRQQIERLQAVNTELLEKIVVRRQLLAGHFEMGRSESQHFICGV